MTADPRRAADELARETGEGVYEPTERMTEARLAEIEKWSERFHPRRRVPNIAAEQRDELLAERAALVAEVTQLREEVQRSRLAVEVADAQLEIDAAVEAAADKSRITRDRRWGWAVQHFARSVDAYRKAKS